MQPNVAHSTPPATIVPLVAADYARWLPLWRGYLDFYRAAVDATTMETTFTRLTGGVEPMGGFLARGGDGAAIGLVHWTVRRSCWSVGDYCYLHDPFVAAGRRSRAHWLTHEANADAMRLYDKVAERSGFVQYRIRIG